MKVIIYIMIFINMSCFGSFIGNNRKDEEIIIDLWERGKQVNIKYDGVAYNKFGNSLVSIVWIDNIKYFVADYRSVYLVDIEKSTISEMKMSNNIFFNPAGLYYFKSYNLLFVANYKGGNILILKPDYKEGCLNFVSEFGKGILKGPENIFVSSDGKLVFVADYDGNSIVAFKRTKNNNYNFIWKSYVPLAHGVTYSGNYVYATSLGNKSIIKMDFIDGEILEEKPSINEKERLMYPTSISICDDDRLVVSDAHRGYILIYSKVDIKMVSYFGGNGPTYKYLNLPYSVVCTDKHIIILSTFQNRIVFLNKKNLKLYRSYNLLPNAWEYVKKEADINKIKNKRYEYICNECEELDILGIKYKIGYQVLYPVEENKPQIIFSDLLFYTDSLFLHFIESRKINDNKFIIISNSSGQGYFFSNINNILFYLPLIPTERDSWLIGDFVYNWKGKIDIKDYIAIFNKKFSNLTNLNKNSIITPNLLYNIFIEKENNHYEWFYNRFISHFSNKEYQKQFLEEYNRCLHSLCNIEERCKIAEGYYIKAIEQQVVQIDEFLLPQLILGCFKPEWLVSK